MANNQIKNEILHSFQQDVKNLITERAKWEEGEYKTSNNVLYNLLGKIYDMYLDTKTKDDADKEKKKWLINECEKREIKYNRKPTFLQLITKLVFANQNVDARRISSYVRVLNAAHQTKHVMNGNDIPNFILKYGGIEEIRASLTKNTKTPKQRAELGKKLAFNKKAICSIETNETSLHASLINGQFVVALGVANARGAIDVKHLCYDVTKNSNLPSAKTAINNLLSNLYSTSNQKNKIKK